ncbi:MAG TPA: hypothetical protein DDZ65_01155 [Firmicutes bacterium]|jgi:peptidoglycan hydrolase-like protein with peptidoglycan-binding domain|nr:hypothetical protein [Bacillota bacterium]
MLPIRILSAAKLPLGARKIKRGACGADVKELQEMLLQRGFFPAEPDGCYGDITDEAVREFQAAHRLRCDGIAGPKVVDALLGTAHDYGEVYVVKQEKNLSEVAAKLAIPLGTLASSNQTSVSAAVYPGQRLKINRRILGAWLEKCGAYLRKDFPAISLLIYPAVTIGTDGGLVQVSPAPAWGVGGAGGGPTHLALAAAFSTPDAVLWQRFLKRRDWWKTWASGSVPAALVFETVAPRKSERRRILRFLRFLRSSRGKEGQPGPGKDAKPNNSSNHVVLSCMLSGAKPAVTVDWLQQLTKYCDYIILWFDPSLSVEHMRRVLRRIIEKVSAGKVLLGIDLAARETVFNDDDDTVVAQNRLGYFEAQARAAGAMRLTDEKRTVHAPSSKQHRRTVPLCSLSHSFRYRMKGQWRTVELLDYQAVITLCSLADEMGLAGAVLRGLEQGDTRLFRALSQIYALADPGWGWERR